MRLSVGEARKRLPAALARIEREGARIVVHHKGRDVGALVPMGDLEILAKAEDVLDLLAAIQAEAAAEAKGEERVPWEKVREQLEL